MDIKKICAICHFSSECGDCCKKCKNRCNGRQICSIGTSIESLESRFKTWIIIVKSNDNFKHLRKYIPQQQLPFKGVK